MGLRREDSLAVLDALMPVPGQEVTLALLSSYSVDLVAVAAVVMALAGEGDDHEQMWKAPLARACEQLRGRIRVICQAGRVVLPPKGQETLVLADQWIREVHRDGRTSSWHPKLALIRYAERDAPDRVHWRLWIGSRNLTRDTSWDSALTAIGEPAQEGSALSGAVAQGGRILAEHAQLPGWDAARVEGELRRVCWRWPEEVEEVLAFHFEAERRRGLPSPPKGLQRVVAISPFLDGTTVGAIGRWGGARTRRELVSTRRELEKLALQAGEPLKGFKNHLYCMEPAPLPEEEEERPNKGDENFERQERGLHAKLIWTRSKSGDALWLGSANLTQRGWSGGNAESMVHLRVTQELSESLLDGFLQHLDAQVSFDELKRAKEENNAVEAHLDAIRNRIAATWNAKLREHAGSLRCENDQPPLHKNDPATLHIRLLASGPWLDWSRETRRVSLPMPPAHLRTELIALKLTSTEDPSQQVTWLARAPLDPPPDEARDRAVLARLMGPRAFLSWLRSLLQEVTGNDEAEVWPPRQSTPNRASNGAHTALLQSPAPSLEAVLKAWGREPDAVRRVNEAVLTWADSIRDAFEESDEEISKQALNALRAFEEHWSVIQEGLGLSNQELE